MTNASKMAPVRVAGGQTAPQGAAAGRPKVARASRMALGAAIARATHHRYDAPRVFEDDYAFAMLYGHWRWVVAFRFLDWLVLRKALRIMRPVYGQVVARSRFSEDALRAAVSRGIRQYVIVGAGLDTFALRAGAAADGVRVFELDHPASQSVKRRQIARLGISPRNVEYISADLEHESLAGALSRSAYDPSQPAFFSWLGTTYYLSEPAVFGTLESIARSAASGSELVFDFCVPDASLAGHDREELAALKRLVARRGEPFVSSFLPAQLAAQLERMGLDLLENASPERLEQRYFAGRTDRFRPSRFAWVAHLRVR